jgi:hypothetical protein
MRKTLNKHIKDHLCMATEWTHGWGDPADPRPTRKKGSNVQQLMPRDTAYDGITGLPQQSAFAVNVYPGSS